jgi:sec-independent protein translocase protein TatB
VRPRLTGELSVFDLSLTKILVLALIGLIVFGPNELPKIAAQAGRALRDLRRIAEGAKADLREGLGPEYQDFDFQDLNPKRFVQKHLLDDVDLAETQRQLFGDLMDDTAAGGAAAGGATVGAAAAAGASGRLAEGQEPPFDLEAT